MQRLLRVHLSDFFLSCPPDLLELQQNHTKSSQGMGGVEHSEPGLGDPQTEPISPPGLIEGSTALERDKGFQGRWA